MNAHVKNNVEILCVLPDIPNSDWYSEHPKQDEQAKAAFN